MWKYRKIDTISNDISNVQLIPNPSKMEYAVYNLTRNSHDSITHIIGLVGKNKMIM